jgi:tetratricopeptide (TPR) repeat protein
VPVPLPPPAPPNRQQLALERYRAGIAAQNAGKLNVAQRAFLDGENLDPTIAENYLALADLYSRRGDLRAAESQLRTVAAFHPSLPLVHYKLAEVQYKRQLYALAVSNYDAELRISPDFRPALEGRDVALRALSASGPAPGTKGGPAAAIAPELIVDARSYLLGEGDDFNFTRALPPLAPSSNPAALEKSLQASPPVGEALSIGSTAMQTGRFDLAARAFAYASGAAPRDWRGPYLGGLVARVAGDPVRARDLYAQALAREERPEVLVSLALLDLEAGDLTRASEQVRRAVALGPSYEPALFSAGMIALIRDERADAERALAAAVASNTAPARTAFFLSAVRR